MGVAFLLGEWPWSTRLATSEVVQKLRNVLSAKVS